MARGHCGQWRVIRGVAAAGQEEGDVSIRVTARARLLAAAGIGALAFVAAIAAPTAARAPSGATFLNDQPVEVTVASGQAFPIVLDAINGSRQPARLKIYLLDVQTAPGPNQGRFVSPTLTIP